MVRNSFSEPLAPQVHSVMNKDLNSDICSTVGDPTISGVLL